MEGFAGLHAVSPVATAVVASRRSGWPLLALMWQDTLVESQRGLWTIPIFVFPAWPRSSGASQVILMLHCLHCTDFNDKIPC